MTQYCVRVYHVVKNVQRRRARFLIFRLLGRWSTRLQHLLHEIESDSRLSLILSDREEVQQVVMAHVRAAGITMLIYEPLELRCVGVSCANILRLQMFQLTMDVVAFAHFLEDNLPFLDKPSSFNYDFEGAENSELYTYGYPT